MRFARGEKMNSNAALPIFQELKHLGNTVPRLKLGPTISQLLRAQSPIEAGAYSHVCIPVFHVKQETV